MAKSCVRIDVISASMGKSKNWLVFGAFVGSLDKNREYKMDFCGTELDTDIPLPDDLHEELRANLAKDFGYAPYNMDDVKEMLGKQKVYMLEK